MPKKKLQVNLKPIAQNIEKAIKTLNSFKKKVSDADAQAIDLKVKNLGDALADVKTACVDKKMTPGFDPK